MWSNETTKGKGSRNKDGGVPQYGPKKFNKSYYSECIADNSVIESNGSPSTMTVDSVTNQSNYDTQNNLEMMDIDLVWTIDDDVSGQTDLEKCTNKYFIEDVVMASPEKISHEADKVLKNMKHKADEEREFSLRIKKTGFQRRNKILRRHRNIVPNDNHDPPFIISRSMRYH